jgi:hypothetical protein
MRGRGGNKEEETCQVGRSYSNSGRIDITASDRRLPHSGNDERWSPATRDGFRDRNSNVKTLQSKKGLSMSVRW